MLKNTPSQYGSLARALHWLMALLIIAMFALGFTMGIPEKGSALRALIQGSHINLGTLTFALLVLRVLWRSFNPVPVAGLSPLNARLAHWGHLLIYALLALQVLAGLAIVMTRTNPTPLWWGFELPGFGGSWHKALEEAHETLAWTLLAVLLGHVLMAVVHKLQGDASQRGMLGR
ncbi:cytochrome b [Gallaecimonas kandeliae]|uniref:cytochrome b n=1 Tax=Gallaecimonas kandeliae TaxID=3029055 RepID=UPI0026474B26|nr:cytochrome b [Gallaecimonas kandeliae]WKE66097.1 cytochrome b [Gallaecimonas kandeliae]